MDAIKLPAYETLGFDNTLCFMVPCPTCQKWHRHAAYEGRREAHCGAKAGFRGDNYTLVYNGTLTETLRTTALEKNYLCLIECDPERVLRPWHFSGDTRNGAVMKMLIESPDSNPAITFAVAEFRAGCAIEYGDAEREEITLGAWNISAPRIQIAVDAQAFTIRHGEAASNRVLAEMYTALAESLRSASNRGAEQPIFVYESDDGSVKLELAFSATEDAGAEVITLRYRFAEGTGAGIGLIDRSGQEIRPDELPPSNDIDNGVRLCLDAPAVKAFTVSLVCSRNGNQLAPLCEKIAMVLGGQE